MNPSILGIGGTNGAGKDTLGELLAKKHGWLFISGSDILRAELRKRGLPIERQNLRDLSAEWRRQLGLGVLIKKAYDKYLPQQEHYNGLVVASLRNPGEADEIHGLGGKVIWIDSDPKIRYERIYSRHRSTEDQKTYEQFLAEEQAEMHPSGDETTLNMAAVKDRADFFIFNDAKTTAEFETMAEKALGLSE